MLLGLVYVVLSFGYFFVVIFFMLQLLTLLKNRPISRKINTFILVSICVALAIGGLAFFRNSIGMNTVGICAVKTDTNINLIGCFTMSISFLLSAYSLVVLMLQSSKSKTDQAFNEQTMKFERSFRRDFIAINSLYIVTFIATRILPIFYLSVVQIPFFSISEEDQDHQNQNTQIDKANLILLSIGGLVLTLLRSIEPNARQYILSFLNCFARTRKESSIQLMELSQQPEVLQTDDYQQRTSYNALNISSDVKQSPSSGSYINNKSVSIFRKTKNR